MPTADVPTTEQFIAAAWKVAPHFGLAPNEITLLSHSENVVCEVKLDEGERCVMRLHRPGYNSASALESEVQWVRSLGEAGLPVPVPCPR